MILCVVIFSEPNKLFLIIPASDDVKLDPRNLVNQPGDRLDGQINAHELVYIETGADSNYINLLQFSTDSVAIKALAISPADIQNGSTKPSLKSQCEQSNTLMVSQCSNVGFSLDAQPLQTRYVTIAFDMVENEVTHHYQIESALRSWAGHLLDASGNIVSDDD